MYNTKTMMKNKRRKELISIIAQIKGTICLKYPEIGFLATKTYIPRRKYRELRKEYNNILPSTTYIETHWGSYKSFMDMWSTTDPRLIKRGEAEEIDETNKPSGQKDDGGYIVEADGVLYNPNTEDYVFDFTNVSNIANVITIKKTQLLAILQDYSNFDNNPQTVAEIALKHKIPTFILEKVLHKLRFRHNSLPITSSYLSEINDDDKVVEDLASLRKFRVAEKYNHQQWKEIQLNANKWIQFEQCIYNPIKDVLSTLKLPKVLPSDIPSSCISTQGDSTFNEDQTFVATLSDVHFGSFSDKNNVFYSEKDWTIDSTKQAVDSYIAQIISELQNMRVKPKNCIVLSLGDILHSITGFTDKGTQLITNPKGVTQFKIALESISYFLQQLSSIWKGTSRIKVYAVSGNHDSFGDWVLFTCLEQMFKDIIDFEISSSRWLIFQLGCNACVIEHGAAARFPSKVPNDDKSKENYVQKLLLDKVSKFRGPIINRYFFMGDRHHYNQKEMSSFEFIQLPTLTPSDEYADNLNLSSRPRQICFVMDKNLGITKTLNFFIDV